ncbi:MAG: hypothetical protein U0636_04310 [Phycisphaerales bacterium]
MPSFFRPLLAPVLAGALCAMLPAPSAAAQFALSDPASQPVMSSRDFNKLMDALNFDAGQRATAGPLFDDVQRELMAARDEADATPPTDSTASARDQAELESSKRRAYQRMRAAEQTFFEGLAALANPGQKVAVEREHLASQRRLIRRTLGAGQSGGVVRLDLLSMVEESKLSDAEKARALEALVGYQTQLTTLLEQALDAGLAVDPKLAKLREQAGKTVDPGQQQDFAIMLNDPLRREASAQFDAVVGKLATLHGQGMAALDQALGLMAADQVNAQAARRIWPRSAMDMRSPRATFAQMRREVAKGKRPAEQLPAVDAAQTAWLGSWWTATRKAAESENKLRAFGMFPQGEDAKPLLKELREAREERDAANRTAWRALAALDTAHADFYKPLMEPPEKGAPHQFGGGDVTPPSLLDPEPGDSTRQFASAVMVMSTSSTDGGEGGEGGGPGEPGEPMEMPLVFEASGNGPIGIMVGPDGVATLISDSMGDGLSGESGFVFGGPGGGPESELSGARVPKPMTRDQFAEYAKALGGPQASLAAVDQLYSDYAQKFKALDDTAGEAVREVLYGFPPSLHSVMIDETTGEAADAGAPAKPARTTRTMDDMRAGISRLDAYVSQLAELDDATLGALGAAVGASAPGSAQPGAHSRVQGIKEERARQRLAQLGYPASPMLEMELRDLRAPYDLATLARNCNLRAADRAAADAVLAEWSPAAVASMEQTRATMRGLAVKILEVEEKLTQTMTETRRAANGSESRSVQREVSAPDQSVMEEHQKLTQKAREAVQAGGAQNSEARKRLEAAVSPEGRMALLSAWCRAVAPRAFNDKKNADTQLAAALALADLSPEQRRQLEALRSNHDAEHAGLTERIGVLAAEIAFPDGESQKAGQPSNAELSRQRSLDRLRFDRSELNERSLRRIRTILTPAQCEAVPGLQPKVVAKAASEGWNTEATTQEVRGVPLQGSASAAPVQAK